MTTFNDLFKSSFLEKVSSFSALDMVIAMALALGLGLFIFLVYKKTFSGVMYSQSFGVSFGGHDADYDADYPGDHLQCGAFFGHGGRFVHRSFSYRHQRAY